LTRLRQRPRIRARSTFTLQLPDRQKGLAMRARYALLSLLLVMCVHAGRAQDASSYSLTPAAAEKFVRATQQMVSTGAAPNVQGNVNPADLTNVKAALDSNPAAQQALTSAGLSSTEYVSFMGAAMAAMMVGQMEMAGVRGMLPPGMTTRPSQPNIDFMKSNVDLFQRAMQPGAPATASGTVRTAAATSDEALPIPANAGTVTPSSILARLPSLDTIERNTDCSLGGLQATVEKEMTATQALHDAYYGNPGDSGLARTPAEGAILKRLEDSDLESCGMLLNSSGLAFTPEYTAADAAWKAASSRISEEQQNAWNACPGIPGGKEPACERQVNADAARKLDAAQRQFLTSIAQPFASRVAATRACNVKAETLVADAKAANVRGANVKLVLRPLVVAWQQAMFLPAEWTGICESAQRSLVE
jgi:hypothetical protein